MTVRRLRVEETPAKIDVTDLTKSSGYVGAGAQEVKKDTLHDVEYWRKVAIQTGERLQYAESQLKDLRNAADEGRARFSKYKDRLDKANERVNDLQVQLVRVSAERDELSARLVRQEVLARKVHEFRQSIMNGPIWELFAELAVGPVVTPGGEKQ